MMILPVYKYINCVSDQNLERSVNFLQTSSDLNAYITINAYMTNKSHMGVRLFHSSNTQNDKDICISKKQDAYVDH